MSGGGPRSRASNGAELEDGSLSRGGGERRMFDQHKIGGVEAPFRAERIGAALGSGGARGWSHIGVLDALDERGVRPEIIVGSSMGALVGAAYATGRLPDLKEWALRLTPRRMLALLDPTLRRGGLMEGARIMRFLSQILPDIDIEEMEIPYLAVATDLGGGQEIWLREGRLIEAVRASIALPGVFSPARRGETWLVDGGLVNPVPVSATRALGADIVIAVNPNSKLRRRPQPKAPEPPILPEGDAPRPSALARLRGGFGQARFPFSRRAASGPSYVEVISNSMEIMTDRIRSSRLAGEPPHVLLQPQLSHRSVLEFYRAAEAIEEGRASVLRDAAALDAFCGAPATPREL